MTLTRWDPFRELLTVQERLSRALADRSTEWTGDDVYGAWSPIVDIYERGDDLVITAEVPGVDRDQLDVRVENGTLTLEGERRRRDEVHDESAYRLERAYGKFSRSFRLPTTVDASRISASFRDGVLEITLPKIEAAKPRKVKIQAA